MNMNTIWTRLIAAAGALALAGCSSNSNDSPPPAAKVAVTNGQQASSGGLADLNGDGIDDMIVCAPYGKLGTSTGLAFVYRGSANGFEAEPYLVLTDSDNFGFAFTRLGDVNNDGIGDFAISSLHGSSSDVSLSGSVTVFKGGGNGAVITRISGEAALDRFGYSLAAGDLNGDGTAELIVGAPFHSPSPDLFQQGAVYIHDFKANSMHAIMATTTMQGIGWSVAAGNVNGDRYDDLLLATQTAYGVGNKVHLFHGQAAFPANAPTPSRTFMSMASGFGESLTVAPDLNNDGYNEILIGASKATVGAGPETGTLFVVKSGTAGTVVNLDATPAALLQKINGAGAHDRFGSPAVALGDLDGKGMSEVAVAATHADSGPYPMTGKVYLLRGEDLATGSATLATATAIEGTGKDMHFGKYLAPFAKNGTRLLIGAPTAFSNSGAVFGYDATSASRLFQASYGGTTSVGIDCCK